MNKNPVKGLDSPRVLVAQCLEHTTGVTEVEGSIPSWNSKTLFSSSFTRCHATTICLLNPLKKSLSTGNFNMFAFVEGKADFDAISFPEPTCLLVSTKTRVLVLIKRHVGSGNEIDFDAARYTAQPVSFKT